MMLNGSVLNGVVLNGAAVKEATATITASAVFSGIAAYYASTEGSIAATGTLLADSAFFYSVTGAINADVVFNGISGTAAYSETVGAINAVAVFTGLSGTLVAGVGVISQVMFMVCVTNDRAYYLVAEPEIHALEAWSQYNLSVDVRRYALIPDFVEAA